MPPFRRAWTGLVAVTCLGCTTLTPSSSRQAPLASRPVVHHEASIDIDEPSAGLTIDDAVRLALARHPALASARSQLDVRHAERIRASQGINPNAALTLEDFAGSGDRQGVEQTETTLRLEQTLELGGKRAAREEEAASALGVAEQAVEVTAADVRAAVMRAYIDVGAAYDRLALTDEVVQLDAQMVQTLARLVAAGRIHAADEQRARAAHATAEVERERAAIELEAARRRLAALWGSPTPRFTTLDGRIACAPLDDARDMASNPDLQRWDALLEQRRAEVRTAKTRMTPDVTVVGGVRHYGDTGEAALVLETRMPLPVRHRNQGDVATAQARLQVAQAGADEVRLALATELEQSRLERRAAARTVAKLEKDVIPAATEALRTMQRGHLEGRFRFNEVLEAQRAWIEARQRLTRAQRECQRAVVQVQRLAGVES